MQPEKHYKKTNPKLSFHLMKFAAQDFKKNSNNLTDDEYNQVFKNANEEMLLHQVILASQEACSVVIPQSILQWTISGIIAEYPDRETFFDMLKANHLSYDEYLAALNNDLRVETILARVASSVKSVKPSEMLRYYKSHYSLFNKPERRDASLIQLFATPSQGFDQALHTITAIHDRLCHHPQNFAEEARNFSECETGKEGGKLGIIVKGELCNALNLALFALDEGEISQVIESADAYHILKCNSIYPAVTIPFEEASVQILPRLLKKKKLNACRSWLQELVQGNKDD